jgi:hypothetical protein
MLSDEAEGEMRFKSAWVSVVTPEKDSAKLPDASKAIAASPAKAGRDRVAKKHESTKAKRFNQ